MPPAGIDDHDADIALLFRGTADDIDQIDVVPNLRYGIALYDGVERHCDVLGTRLRAVGALFCSTSIFTLHLPS
ncbi:hypothetical protein B5P46_09305 [Rhizobium leguminosarum]|uniref:Uncharacterized protein n=1 Tax=Rhizobium leguminosarum TaxID=384 RepID=A0A4Q1UCS4_RHILE|nr:hypothetical protein B5P46_09305 [Rhizobium leguminosarum]